MSRDTVEKVRGLPWWVPKAGGVAIATLTVEAGLGQVVLFLDGLDVQDPPGASVFDAFVMLLVLMAIAVIAAVVFTAVYVMPSVLLAHWASRTVLGRTPWWTIPLATTLYLIPALGPPMLLGALQSPQEEPDPDNWFTPDTWLSWAVLLVTVMTPAALLAHVAATRLLANRPLRLCGNIVGWAALAIIGMVGAGTLLYALR